MIYLHIASADLNRLIKGALNALHPGCNKNRIKPQILGLRMGNHIADHHPVSLPLQHFHRGQYLIPIMNGENINLVFEQVAEHMGASRNTGKSHNRVPLLIVFRQFHRPKDVVH